MKIAVDLDDVLAHSALSLINYSNSQWGTNLSIYDYSEDWVSMWQTHYEDALQRSLQWHASREFGEKPPRAESLPVLKHLASKHDLVILTSRKKIVSDITLDWVARHYAGIFSDVHFAGIWDDADIDHTLQIKGTKSTKFTYIEADILIDDQVKHCNAIAELGKPAVLFGEYAWTDPSTLHPAVVHCKNWKDVEVYFEQHG